MIYARARLRYLAALGLPALVFPMFACSGGGSATSNNTTPTGPSEGGVATVAIPETTAAANATETTTGTDAPATTATATGTDTTKKVLHTTAWIPDQEAQGTKTRIACSHGLVCIPKPASLAGAAAAPSPFGACAAEPTEPENPTNFPGMARFSFHADTTAKERKADPAACCYEWTRPCKGGRIFRGVEGEILASDMRRGDWLAGLGDVDVGGVPAADRAAAAAHFAREAAFEHASIAAFGRAAMGLLAMGAPPGLVADTHAAAVDEVEHARIAFGLASAFGGEPRGPSRLDVSGQVPLPASLADLAMETFVDACVGETVAALGLREAADGASLSVIGSLLDRIASDEERHAALAWRTVAWALREGGAPVREALFAATAALEREAPTEGAADGAPGLPGLGIPGAQALAEVRARAIREVVLPCAAALLAVGSRGVAEVTGEAATFAWSTARVARAVI